MRNSLRWLPCYIGNNDRLSFYMYPTVLLFGKDIPSYWLCSLLGILICSIAAKQRHKKFTEFQSVDLTNSAALMGIGALIGSRILYLITILPILIPNYRVLLNDLSLAYEVLSNGMVFYGGLIGALLSLHIYTKHYHLDQCIVFDFFAPLVPLFHSFGRLGCFFTGCCYGKEDHVLGLIFSKSQIAPNDIPLFPIQLLSSFLDFILFLAVLYYESRHHKEGTALPFYLLVYSMGRFILEFFRGDELRGIFCGFSTSQWISIFIFITVMHWARKKALSRS